MLLVIRKSSVFSWMINDYGVERREKGREGERGANRGIESWSRVPHS